MGAAGLDVSFLVVTDAFGSPAEQVMGGSLIQPPGLDDGAGGLVDLAHGQVGIFFPPGVASPGRGTGS